VDPADWTGVGVAAAAAAGGAFLLKRAIDRRPRAVPVIRYALVGPPRAGSPINDLRVPMSAFRAQIRHIARRGFRAVTLSEVLANRGKRAFLDSNPVALTFDGPWQSFLASAWPVLADHGLNRVTLFFPAGKLGEDQLRYAHGRAEPLLSTQHLRLLAGDGIEIGLLSADDIRGRPEDVAAQWRRERDQLAEAVGHPVRVLALPYHSSDGFSRAARDAGLEAAVRVGGGGIVTRWSNRFSLPRYSVQPGSELVHVAFCLSRRKG
jgi:peptidoglycan/xylan/chitin deacetylase (PgdA/CDA1 family)